MELHTPLEVILLRLSLAIVLGGVLGGQREAKRKPAGLKTHMMVSLGAASFTLVTLELFLGYVDTSAQARLDPLRIIEGVIGGIGFLGAGTIIQARGSVQGITTAATVWVVGSVGIACGIGAWQLATIVAGIAFVILTIFNWIETHLIRREEVVEDQRARHGIPDQEGGEPPESGRERRSR